MDTISRVGVGFVTYFLFLGLLGAESYSAFILTSLVSGVVQQLSKLGQNDFLMVADDPSDKIISGLLTINLVFAVLSTLILVPIFLIISYFRKMDEAFILASSMMSASVFITIFSTTFLISLQKKQKFKQLFLFNFSALIFAIISVFSLSYFIDSYYYPAVFVLATSIFLLSILLLNKPFKLKFSIKNALDFYTTGLMFMLPLAKTRPIMVASKNIDSFLVLSIGGDILLLAYNTVKKILVYPLTIVYGIIDRWLYPLLAKFRNREKVKKFYFVVVYIIFTSSIFCSIVLALLINYFDTQIFSYFKSLGVLNIDIINICSGFLLTWPLFVLPTLVYPFAKVIRVTSLLPKLSLSQVIFFAASLWSITMIFGENWITFGYSLAYLFINLYILMLFRFFDLKSLDSLISQ